MESSNTKSPPLYVDNELSMYIPANMWEYNFIDWKLSARVGRLNPAWNEDASTEKTNAQFVKAVELTGSEFREHLKELALSCWPARSIVEQAFHRRQQVDESGRIVVLDQYCPWQSHLFDIEKEVCSPLKSLFSY